MLYVHTICVLLLLHCKQELYRNAYNLVLHKLPGLNPC